jgi:hypothetical protein
MTLFSVDPAVVDESTGRKLDPALDMYNPANGFKPAGTTYSQAFVDKFLTAEAQRYNRIVDFARARLAAIESGKGRYSDDEGFEVPVRAAWDRTTSYILRTRGCSRAVADPGPCYAPTALS